MFKIIKILIIFIGFAVFRTAFCQVMPVPVDVQFNLFMKIFSFDRNLTGRVENEIVLGVLYQKKYRESLTTKNKIEDMVKIYNSLPEIKTPVNFVPLEIKQDTDINEMLSRQNLDVLYLCPVRAVDITQISTECRNLKISSVTGVPEYLIHGISVGLDIKGQKPQILINLDSARLEGSDYSSQLLKLAKIIDG